MKLWKQPAIGVYFTVLALVFSLTGCTKTDTTSSRAPSTGQSEVREMPEQTKTGWTEATQKAETGLQKIAASSNQALKKLGVNSQYGQAEEKEFLSACKQSCLKESPQSHPNSNNVTHFCELYCGCTHDNLETKVPFNDLQAYTNGQTSKSNQAIIEIRDQCVRDAHAATQKSSEGRS
ncbi:hypothetical protein [Vampirovibrio sp.]|uniref:hypothetical protein n=1 Tax=Vampirovibrio sp. TaxID=2717857 RepID=UPI003592F9DE